MVEVSQDDRAMSDTEVLHAALVRSIRQAENTKRIYDDLNRGLEAVLEHGTDSLNIRALAIGQETRAKGIAKGLSTLWLTPEFKALPESAQQTIHDALNDLDYINGAANAIRKAAAPKPVEGS